MITQDQPRRYTSVIPAGAGWTVRNLRHFADGTYRVTIDRVVAFGQVDGDEGTYLVPLISNGTTAVEAGVGGYLSHENAEADEEEANSQQAWAS